MSWRRAAAILLILGLAAVVASWVLARMRARTDPNLAGSAASAASDDATDLRAQSHALAQAGRWPESIAKLQEAIRVGAYDEGDRYLLGHLMARHAPPQQMLEYYAREARLDPQPQTSLYFWALALERQGALEAAHAKLGEALEVDPAHELSEDRRGAIRERQGRLDEALAHYRTATEILPDFREAHENAARVLDRLGRAAEARAARAAAAAVDPERRGAPVAWARYLLKKGRREAAVAVLQRALAADPNDTEAKRLLEQSQ
jgi:tetratricopeptide (TPR) repeat protein